MLDILVIFAVAVPIYGLLRLLGRKPSFMSCAAFVAIPIALLAVFGHVMLIEAAIERGARPPKPPVTGIMVTGGIIWYGMKDWAEERRVRRTSAVDREVTGSAAPAA